MPRTTTLPVPLGARSRFALLVVTMSLPLVSRSPPSWGEVSATILPPETADAVAADAAAAVADADAFDACVLAVEALELALEA